MTTRIAMAALCVVVSLLAASCKGGGSKHGASATSTTTTTAAPAVACPGSSDAKSSTSSTAANATWTGVFERVRVHLDNDGSVKKTPRQHTIVSASGNGPVTVAVPVADSHLHRKPRGKKPHVVDGKAQVDLNPNGTATEQLDSDYTRPLPVAVQVTYKLNGHAVSAKGVKGKSGSVEVAYKLTNTTSMPVSVCFNGFNGKLVEQVVTVPQPILAYLSFDVPKHASSFHAEDAALAPARKGISASWTRALFKPFGPTSQTFVFTMNTHKASIPNATLLLETLDPLQLTESAPAKTAAALDKAEAEVYDAVAQVQSDVTSLQQQQGSKSQGGKSRGRTSNISISSLTGLQAHAGKLDRTTRTFGRSVGASNGTLAQSDRRSVAGLGTNANDAIVALGASTSRAVDDLTATLNHSLARLTRDVGRASANSSITAMTREVSRLQASATVLRRLAKLAGTTAVRLHKGLDDLIARLPAPVANALLLVQKINRVQADLDALSPAEQATPGFQGVVADVSSALAVANSINSELTSLQSRVQALRGQVQTFQSDLTKLQTRLAALETAAAAVAQAKVVAALTGAVADVQARVNAAAAAAARAAAGAGQDAKQTVSSAEQSAESSVSAARDNASKSVSAAERRAKKNVEAAERKADRQIAAIQHSVDEALSSTKQKAVQSGRATLASTQADADRAEASAKSALNKANATYARLLATNEQAVANQLPGGNAAVTEQNGSFLYQIAGT